MKKVLFGIMALSTLSLGANPGVVGTDGVETASVPVRVIAELIPAPNGLTITDEAGTVLDELVLDHGRMVLGQATGDSTVFKPFKVKRFNASGEAVEIGNTGNQAPAQLKVSLKTLSTDSNASATSTILKLNGVDASDSQNTLTLTSNLSLLGSATGTYTQTLDGKEKEHIGRVTSRISVEELKKDKLVSGIYHNAAQHMLEVVYTPATSSTR